MGPGQEEKLLRTLTGVCLPSPPGAGVEVAPLPVPPPRVCSWSWKGNVKSRLLGKVEGSVFFFLPLGSKTAPQARLCRCQEAARRKKKKQSLRSGVQTS